MKTYGITRTQDQDSLLVEQVHRLGFTVLHDVVPSDVCAEARERLDAVYQRQSEEFGAELLASIKEKDLARLPLSYDQWFFRFLNFSKVADLVSTLIGDFHILNLQNGIINRPSVAHHQASWHRDLPYQNWVCSRPLAINALFCIDDFNTETGGTYVLPHTHRFEDFPSAGYVERHEQPVTAEAGSVIIFDAMLFHRAGANTSNRIRRGLNHLYTIPLLKQQISVPRCLSSSKVDPPNDLRRLLGYDTQEPESVNSWREHRLAKSSGK
jgi:ectoine hydroxylase-related dioxygenase (phytanoyl-CoA dioxygenase family)